MFNFVEKIKTTLFYLGHVYYFSNRPAEFFSRKKIKIFHSTSDEK